MISLGLLAAIALFSRCNSPREEKNNAGNDKYCLDEAFKSKMEWVQPEMKSVTQGIHLTGSVESNPDKVIHFVSLVDGIVSNTYFSLGDQVAKGQVLAELRSTELSGLQSQSQTIDAQIKVGEKKLQAVLSMYNDGISSQKELTEAQSELDILKAERERINANLNLFSASPEKDIFQIKAPTSGIITSKSIAAGTQISAASESLFTVSDLSEVWIMVNIYAGNIQHIETGMEVNIKTLSYPDELFTGKIAVISQVLDTEAKVLKARVVLQNMDFKLKPGMSVDVTALKQGSAEALSIPKTVIVFDNNQNYVVVYEDDCGLEIRQVEILTQNSECAFLSEGMHENEKIVAKNQLLIYEQIKNFQY